MLTQRLKMSSETLQEQLTNQLNESRAGQCVFLRQHKGCSLFLSFIFLSQNYVFSPKPNSKSNLNLLSTLMWMMSLWGNPSLIMTPDTCPGLKSDWFLFTGGRAVNLISYNSHVNAKSKCNFHATESRCALESSVVKIAERYM